MLPLDIVFTSRLSSSIGCPNCGFWRYNMPNAWAIEPPHFIAIIYMIHFVVILLLLLWLINVINRCKFGIVVIVVVVSNKLCQTCLVLVSSFVIIFFHCLLLI